MKNSMQKESWVDTIHRVVNGTFQMQYEWMTRNQLPWDQKRSTIESEDMFDRIFNMKFLPPGRGLWAMGTALTTERRLFAALNNCAFVSTKDMAKDPANPFCFLMDASMLGVGVGFDTKGANSIKIYSPLRLASDDVTFKIPDSREGWVESLRILLNAFFVRGSTLPQFDYSLIRPANQPIKGFGGVSQGPDILVELHMIIADVLAPKHGTLISETVIVVHFLKTTTFIMNLDYEYYFLGYHESYW
jgi:ribonucleoside-triphosphate reductase